LSSRSVGLVSWLAGDPGHWHRQVLLNETAQQGDIGLIDQIAAIRVFLEREENAESGDSLLWGVDPIVRG
jgi:hypothetical protein